MWDNIIFGLLGGMGLLLYGMQILSEGLQKMAGHRLRTIMSSLTHNRFAGLSIGALVTILFQSSTATTVILVSLTSAGIIGLRQTLPVILGADIGTTVTAQLIALKVTEISMPIVGIGATIMFFSKRHRYKQAGQAILGFGLLFLGLKIMSDTMYPLREAPFFIQMLSTMSDYPLLAMIAAALFTFLVHSSAAAVGIIMVLAMQDMISLHAAIYLLFGANIGTSFTAVLSSLGSSREAQRVATAHLLFKMAGVLLFLPFVNPFAALIAGLTSAPGYQVANVHTIFNITLALVFLPFTTQFAALLEKIVPERKDPEAFHPHFLDDKMLETPSIALGLATKEIIHTSDYIYNMTAKAVDVFERNDALLLHQINKEEERVDILFQATNRYLTHLLRQPLSRKEFVRCMSLIHIVNDYEHIGDIIEKNVTSLAQCKIDGHCDFSDEGWDEISIMHQRVCDLMQMVNAVLVTNDDILARRALQLQPEIVKMERHLRILHIHRLRLGVQKSEESSSVHLDLINSFLRISEHVKNIAEELLRKDIEVTDQG
ncbi:MAG: Na/Pi cotransporter family protein [Bacillota bacterium]|jgi:phosphate:Na+ symporter